MPIYEYECTPCGTVYETRHGMGDPGPAACPQCAEPVQRRFSAPGINRFNYSSPTQARYARMSPREEIAREEVLQRDYRRIWLPPPVKHDPWDG